MAYIRNIYKTLYISYMFYIRNISGTYMNYIGNIYEIGYMGFHGRSVFLFNYKISSLLPLKKVLWIEVILT